MDEKHDLTKLNREVPKKRNDLLIVLLILFVACLCVGSYLIGKSLENDKKEETPIEVKKDETKEVTEEKEETKTNEPTLGKLLIDKADQKLIEKDLLKPNEIEYRSSRVIKRGYYKFEPNKIYYAITGQFKCKNNSSEIENISCLYQPQVGDPDEDGKYNYSITFSVEETDEDLVIGEFTELPEDENFVEINEDIE